MELQPANAMESSVRKAVQAGNISYIYVRNWILAFLLISEDLKEAAAMRAKMTKMPSGYSLTQ